jgi:hypothetical protein
MPQPANFDGFYFNPASNLWAFHAVTSAICQRSPQPLRELLTLGNGYMQSHSKICRIWRPCFNIDGCATLWTVALKRPIFKRKKKFANICLNYCSMGSSWPRSRDTVPLTPVLDYSSRCVASLSTVPDKRWQLSNSTWQQLFWQILPYTCTWLIAAAVLAAFSLNSAGDSCDPNPPISCFLLSREFSWNESTFYVLFFCQFTFF